MKLRLNMMNGIGTGVNGNDIIGENTLRSPCLLNKLTHSTMQYASRNDDFYKSEMSNLPSELWNTFQLQRRQKQISKIQYPKKRLTNTHHAITQIVPLRYSVSSKYVAVKLFGL